MLPSALHCLTLCLLLLFLQRDCSEGYQLNKDLSAVQDIKTHEELDQSNDGEFFHFYASNVKYPYIFDQDINIGAYGAIFEREYYTCTRVTEKSEYTDHSYVIWKYDRENSLRTKKIRNVQYQGFNLSKKLFENTDSNRILVPKADDIEAFKSGSRLHIDGWQHIGMEWFYRSKKRNITKILNTLENSPKKSNEYVEFIIINDDPARLIVAIIIKFVWRIILHLISEYNNKSSSRNHAIETLFRNCEPGEQRMRLKSFDATNLSVLSYRNGTELTTKSYQERTVGKVVPGRLDPTAMQGTYPPKNQFSFIFLGSLSFLITISLYYIFGSHKKLLFSSIFVSITILAIRSVFYNRGHLSTTRWTVILVIYLIIMKFTGVLLP